MNVGTDLQVAQLRRASPGEGEVLNMRATHAAAVDAVCRSPPRSRSVPGALVHGTGALRWPWGANAVELACYDLFVLEHILRDSRIEVESHSYRLVGARQAVYGDGSMHER